MKIIEALKQIKDLQRKAEDIRNKIGVSCADLSIETPAYGENQKEQVRQWLQAHSDIIKEILRLRFAVMGTNVVTSVTIELGGKQVTKTIAEWLLRRGGKNREGSLSALELAAWSKLTDRGLKGKEGAIPSSTGGESQPVKVRYYFDPAERDVKKDELQSEPSLIDGRLEVVNAVTDLVE